MDPDHTLGQSMGTWDSSSCAGRVGYIGAERVGDCGRINGADVLGLRVLSNGERPCDEAAYPRLRDPACVRNSAVRPRLLALYRPLS